MSENSFIKCLEPINLYGLGFPLRYKKDDKYQTTFGLILSILTLIFIIIISSLFGSDVILRTGYSIVTNYLPIKKKITIDFSKRPFMIGFASNGKISPIDFSYISISFERNVHNAYLDDNGIYQLERISNSIELEYCNISKHYIGKNEFMHKFDYNSYLCPKSNQNLNFGGRFGDNINGYDLLEIHLNKCSNTTVNNNCKSEEIIDKFLDNSYLEMVYLSESVDHSNISYPLIENLRNQLYIVAKEHVKRYYQYFQISSYSSDTGLIFENIQKFEFAETKSLFLDFVKDEEQKFYTSSALLEIALTLTDEQTIYERKYVKVQNVLGNIGGFINVLFVFFQYITSYFTKKTLIVDVTNKIIIQNDKNIPIIKIPFTKKNFINSYKTFNVSKKSQINSSSSRFKLVNENKKNLTINNTKIKSTFSNQNNIDKSKKTNLNKEGNINKKKQSRKVIKNNNNKKFQISYYYYFLPLFYLKKRYDNLKFYTNLFHKYMSIEIIIPLIERLSKMNLNQQTKDKNNYFKLNSTMVSISSKNN